jgi:hypothetical protein
MFDRRRLGRILDIGIPIVLLVAAAVGAIHAVTIATTLQDLRAREPLGRDAQPELQVVRCMAASGEAEPGPSAGGAPPAAITPDRSGNCPTQRPIRAQ